MTVDREGPSAATSAMASRMSGNDIIASSRREIGASRLRKKPAATPRMTPSTVEMTTTPRLTSSEIRPAKIAREKMSRPNSSVPKKFTIDGGFSLLTIESLFGA